jgi:hypothetical protein
MFTLYQYILLPCIGGPPRNNQNHNDRFGFLPEAFAAWAPVNAASYSTLGSPFALIFTSLGCAYLIGLTEQLPNLNFDLETFQLNLLRRNGKMPLSTSRGY